MNKRSALMLSAGLVLTLIVGGLAVATGLTGPSVSNAVPRVQRSSASEPVVRTVRRTVTVHKKADAAPGQVVQIGAPAATSASSTSGTAGSDDDSYEDSYEDDDDSADEQDDHEDQEDREDHEDEGDDD